MSIGPLPDDHAALLLELDAMLRSGAWAGPGATHPSAASPVTAHVGLAQPGTAATRPVVDHPSAPGVELVLADGTTLRIDPGSQVCVAMLRAAETLTGRAASTQQSSPTAAAPTQRVHP